MSGVVIGGIVSGCLYALVALGLVLIFRTSGAVNFAQGDVGSLGMFLALGLTSGQWAHLSVAVGVGLGLLLAGVANVLVYLLVIRMLEGRKADLVTTLVATLGISQVIEGVLPIPFGYNPFSLPLFRNSGGLDVFGTNVPYSGVAIVISAAAVLIGFAILLYRTRIGLVLRMGASNAHLTEMSGVPLLAIKISLWFIAGIISAWGVMLFSAYDNVSTTTMSGFLLAAAVAASWGAFRSIPWTIGGAIAVGVITNVVAQFAPVSLTQSVSFALLLIVFIVFQRRGAPVLARLDLEKSFARHVRPLYRRWPKICVGELVVVVLIGFGALYLTGTYFNRVVLDASALAVVLVGLALSIRYGSRLNLAGAAYVGLGAYAFAITTNLGWAWPAAVLVALAGGSVVGMLLGLVTLRLETIFFVNLGLVLSAAIPELVLLFPKITGGSRGLSVTPPLSEWTFAGAPAFNVIVLLIALVLLGAYVLHSRSNTAARTLVSGTDMALARVSGLRTGWHLVLLEGVSAAVVAAGGILIASSSGFISPSQFGVMYSNALIAAIILGGAWGAVGIVTGAFFGAVVPTLLASLDYWPAIINGLVLVVVIVLFPAGVEGGLAAQYARLEALLRRRSAPPSGPPGQSPGGDQPTRDDVTAALTASTRLP